MNNELLRPFSDIEIKKVLFMMHLNKSPGPDDFTDGFYIKHWSILKEVVCKTMRTFMEGG